MQFVKNGPDVPDRLLQLHEDGRVVFFCGAGISCPAGLPRFKGLAKELFDRFPGYPNAAQDSAMKAGQFDEAIGLLENEVVGGEVRVRRILAQILTPAPDQSNATATHEALLTLGTNRDGRVRLVTTNFDRLFEKVIAKTPSDVKTFQAPLSSMPKNSLDGLVYLHGLLPEESTSEKSTTEALYNLVVSNNDFGRAYLKEGWATRFINELFYNYTICFVGYGINDPMVRYILDAWAADKLSSGSPSESDRAIFAFVDYAEGEKSARESEWKARQVTPILYPEYEEHYYLHRTLKSWANIYRDGVRGKERVVLQYAMKNPSPSTGEDDFVGRTLWALSDPSGLPAKRFAEHKPVPSLDWLEVFCDNRYGMEDLDRFGIARSPVHDDQRAPLQFSLLRRPVSSCDRGPRMALVGASADSVILDDVMRRLGDWLARHLNNPELLFWVANQGGRLHSEFAEAVEKRLDKIAELEQADKHDEIKRIQTHAPDAIPSPGMRAYWRLAVTGRLSWRQDLSLDLDLYSWHRRFQRDGLTPSIRSQLCEILRPRISLEKAFTFSDGRFFSVQDKEEPARCIRPEIVLCSIRDMFAEDQQWKEALPDLMEDVSRLLRETLDLMRELEKANDENGRAYIPSISDHPQNDRYDEWTILITLCRDAWLAMAKKSPADARLITERWWRAPYPIFKRLALFSAAQDGVIPVELALDWLTAEEDGWWLWSPETMREVMRLLVALAGRLEGPNLERIEQTILRGPPRKMYREDVQKEQWDSIVDRSIWLRLAKLEQGGADLHPDVRKKREGLANQYPDCSLEQDEKEEFPIWTESGSGIRPISQATPRLRHELVEWLKKNREFNFLEPEDDWKGRCQNNFSTAAYALSALAKENVWPPDRWWAALFEWSREGADNLTKRSWHDLAPVLAEAPDKLVQSVDHAIGEWLESVAKVFDQHEELFTKLCARVLKVNSQQKNGNGETDDGNDLPTEAINHPVGKVTEALFCWQGRQPLEDGQGLSGDLRDIFTDLCNPNVKNFRHGRVLLAARVITLFRVDREWTTEHLLPLFDWRHPSEACAVWQGFLLWSPGLYRPLMEAIKPHFLATAQHCDKLGRWSGGYSHFLAVTALGQPDIPDIFDRGELAQATASLPPDELHQTANTLVQALKSVNEKQRTDYWENRMQPYLESAWPQSRRHKTRVISITLAMLCVAARKKFPDAIKILDPWLQRLPGQGSAIKDLHKTGLCKKFPVEALRFLDKTVSNNYHSPDELRVCLQSIREAKPRLSTDPGFQRQFQRLEYITSCDETE